MLHHLLTILQVEDTRSDAVLTAAALTAGGIPHVIHVVNDGKKAIAFLQHGPGYADSPRPDLILLDLGLPGLSGQEVLRFIKGDEILQTIPVVVFTTVDTDVSQQMAYKLHANSYVVKPMDLPAFTHIIQSIAAYWSEISSMMPRRLLPV